MFVPEKNGWGAGPYVPILIAIIVCVAILCLAIAATVPLASAQIASPSDDVEKRTDSLLRTMTLDEKINLLGGTEGMNTSPISRIGLPALRMSDGPVGVHDYGPTTAYPAGIALAASWDTDLARRVGESMGDAARARGVHFILGETLGIGGKIRITYESSLLPVEFEQTKAVRRKP